MRNLVARMPLVPTLLNWRVKGVFRGTMAFPPLCGKTMVLEPRPNGKLNVHFTERSMLCASHSLNTPSLDFFLLPELPTRTSFGSPICIFSFFYIKWRVYHQRFGATLELRREKQGVRALELYANFVRVRVQLLSFIEL
jgi:hypothetical protein